MSTLTIHGHQFRIHAITHPQEYDTGCILCEPIDDDAWNYASRWISHIQTVALQMMFGDLDIEPDSEFDDSTKYRRTPMNRTAEGVDSDGNRYYHCFPASVYFQDGGSRRVSFAYYP